MKKIVKYLLAGVAVAGVASAIAVSALRPLEVQTITAEPKMAYSYFLEDGTVVEGKDFSIYAEVSGQIIQTMFTKGDYVYAGETILEIEDTESDHLIEQHRANIDGYEAKIDEVRDAEENTIDDYNAAIRELEANLLSIEGQRETANADRRQAVPRIDGELRALEISIEQAKKDFELADENFVKIYELFEAGVLPKSEADDAKAEVDRCGRQIKLLEAEYEAKENRTDTSAEAALGESKYFDALTEATNEQIRALRNNAGKNYSGSTVAYYNSLIDAENVAIDSIRDATRKYRVDSPVSGTIVDMPAENVSAISAGQCAAVVKTVANVKIEAYVSTKDIEAVNVGDLVVMIKEGRNRDLEFEGEVESIADWAEAKTSALGIDEKKVLVTMITEEQDLKAGYDLDIRFTAYKVPNKLMVPTGAIFTDDDKDYVFVVENGKAVQVEVKKGERTLTETTIEFGIDTRDIIIAEANMEGLKAGTRVKPINEQKEDVKEGEEDYPTVEETLENDEAADEPDSVYESESGEEGGVWEVNEESEGATLDGGGGATHGPDLPPDAPPPENSDGSHTDLPTIYDLGSD